MKRILLCTDGSVFAQSSYQYGAWFAQRLGSAIDVLHVTDVRGKARADAANLSGSIGINASDNLLKKLVDLEYEKAKLAQQQAKVILQSAEDTLRQQGVAEIHTMHKTGFLVDYLPELEITADMIILGKRGESAEFASGHLGANLERIIRASHKPCFVTSRQFRPIERLLVAYDGSENGKGMLKFLLSSPAFQGLELHLVTVAKEKSDTTAAARLQAAQQQAQTAGFNPIVAVIAGEPENVIAQYGKECDASLLAMGAYGHSRIRNLVIGSTTAQILRSSNIPVLVFR